MNENQKRQIITAVGEQLPGADEGRLENLLAIILLEISTLSECEKEIPWTKLMELIIEILYQTAKNESDVAVASVKRGDTTVAYQSTTKNVQATIAGYKDLLRRLIGCTGSGVVFFA
mgnify:CR=1 FL=1